jgi:hypothetical protein
VIHRGFIFKLEASISPTCSAPAVACVEDHCYDEPGYGELPTQYDTGTGRGQRMIGEMRVSPLRNLINQVGTSSSYTQQMLSGAFLVVVVTAQIYLTRNRTF